MDADARRSCVWRRDLSFVGRKLERFAAELRITAKLTGATGAEDVTSWSKLFNCDRPRTELRFVPNGAESVTGQSV